MIRVELPRNRAYCGTLRVLGESGDTVFGPVPVAGLAETPCGIFQIAAISAKHGVVVLDARPPLALQGQPVEYGEDLCPASGGLRISGAHMRVLLELLDVYGGAMACTIADGEPTGMKVCERSSAASEHDETYVRRVLLAAQAKACLS
jgi:hypothetical protein